ncbi:MAG: hypothetical protein LBL66_10505, partial [Clostridiales bacterium]|nr:hypothetical protein [Clostridiales bacterium]
MEAMVKIEYLGEDDGAVEKAALDATVANNAENINNVSQNYERYLLGTENNRRGIYLQGAVGVTEGGERTVEGFKYGFLNDGTNGLFDENGYRGYNSRNLSAQSKADGADPGGYVFAEGARPIFKVTGEDITTFIIAFDDVDGEYAPAIGLEWQEKGQTVRKVKENYRNFYVYRFEKPVQEFIVTILSWSKPETIAKVTRINTTYTKVYENNRIIDAAASREDRSDPLNAEYGLSSQYGSVAILDNTGEFQILNEFDYLTDNLNVSVEIAKGADEKPAIGAYKTRNWNINANDLSVKVDLTDALEKLKEIKIPALNLRQLNYMFGQPEKETVTGRELIEKLLEIGGVGDIPIHYDGHCEPYLR